MTLFQLIALVLMLVAVVLAFNSGEIKGAGFLLWLSIAVILILGNSTWSTRIL